MSDYGLAHLPSHSRSIEPYSSLKDMRITGRNIVKSRKRDPWPRSVEKSTEDKGKEDDDKTPPGAKWFSLPGFPPKKQGN